MAPLNTSPGWVYWLEAGGGVRWLRRAALLLALLLLSLVVAHTQFRGPRSEATFRQAAAARQWAEGRGYAAPVIDPQTVAWAEARGRPFSAADVYPELRYTPLYPAVLAGALAALPDDWREAWLSTPPEPPDGFGGDYVLLAVNVLLLWVAAVQTWLLGRRLFGGAAGVGAAVALLLSAAIWQETVAVNGTPLAMVLLLAVFQALARAWTDQRGRARGGWLAAGACAGLLFLLDYTSAALAPLVVVAVMWRAPSGRRAVAFASVTAGLMVVCAPWLARNTIASGHPLGLAWHDVALRAGDPTAEPDVWRRSFKAEAPALEIRKFANKGLTALQDAVGGQLWTGGLFLGSLFFAGWLYRFQDRNVRDLRILFAAALVALVLAQGFFNSGEGERLPALVATPLLLVFGAGFFRVLLDSHAHLSARPFVAWGVLLGLQAIPLIQDVAEPRRVHFHYPPYHPGVFVELGRTLGREGGTSIGWMADVPAGAAWYSGQRVWAQPVTLREFRMASLLQPIEVLVLTPRTLDRPFFSELLRPSQEASRFGDWGRVYTGLIQDRLPADFPLSQQQKLAENFRVLAAPGSLR